MESKENANSKENNSQNSQLWAQIPGLASGPVHVEKVLLCWEENIWYLEIQSFL